MNTLPAGLYSLINLGLGGETFQSFVDKYAQKYDVTEIEGFRFAPVQLGYTFSQIISSAGASTLMNYVDPESEGYETSLGSIEGVTDNIPTMKKFYRLNRVTVREKMQLIQKMGGIVGSNMSRDIENAFLSLLDEGTDHLIQSFYNTLNNQRHQIVSTGKYTIDNTFNPRGIKGVTIQFNIAAPDVLTGTARWWTNANHTVANEGSASDPIKYMKDRVKYIRRTKHYVGRLVMEISQDLLDDLLTHTKVLTQIGLRLYPAAASDATGATALNYAKNVSDEALIEELRRIIKVDAIKVRDTFAYMDSVGTDADGLPDIVQTSASNFDEKNIVFLPDGNLGDIRGVEPLTLGYEPDKVARHNDGRLILSERAIAKAHSIYIDAEAAQICVPSVPQFIFISTVTV